VNRLPHCWHENFPAWGSGRRHSRGIVVAGDITVVRLDATDGMVKARMVVEDLAARTLWGSG